MLGDPPVMSASLKVVKRKDYGLPSSIESFIDIYLKPKEKFQRSANPDLQNILLSDSLSRALTFLYAIDVLFDPCYTEKDSLVVHVIGSTSREFSERNFWKFILLSLQHLKNLTIIFVGPKIEAPTLPPYLEADIDFSSCMLKNQNLRAESQPLKYNDYYHSKVFVEPDFVIGYNLDLHESELGISECTWKKTVLILQKMGVPFVMTSGSETRIKKDDRSFCKLLGDTELCHIDYDFCEVNPFASLIPERDFETEGLRYSNKYILTYTRLDSKNIRINSNLTLAQLKQEEMLESHSENGSKASTKEEIKEEKKSLENRECREVKINKEPEKNLNRGSGELLNENVLLKEENKLLKENYSLKEENVRLKIENLNLREENLSLKAENLLIKDIRTEVQESIRSAMKDN